MLRPLRLQVDYIEVVSIPVISILVGESGALLGSVVPVRHTFCHNRCGAISLSALPATGYAIHPLEPRDIVGHIFDGRWLFDQSGLRGSVR